MSLRSLIHLLLLALSLLPLNSHAQLKDGHYFQATAQGKAITNTLWYQQSAEKRPIGATLTMRSRDYAYDAGERITFYGDRIDAEGNPIPEAIAVIPKGATRLLLHFSHLSTPDENGLNYKVTVYKDDTKTFPFGSFQFVNNSATDTNINLGGLQFLLKRGASQNVPIEPPEKGDLSIKIVPTTDNQSGSRYSNGWGHRSNLRTLVFIVDGRNGRIKPLRYRQTEPTK